MLTIVGHATSVAGKVHEPPTNVLVEVLAAELQSTFTYIRYPLNDGVQAELFEYRKGKLVLQKKLTTFRWGGLPVLYFSQVVGTLFLLFINRKKWSPCRYIGVDPLNAFAGIVARQLGLVEQVVFYSVDYTPQRFSNAILNACYQSLDRFAAKYADTVWSVSTRIQAMRIEQGISQAKNKLLPNVPSASFRSLLKIKKTPYSLVTLGVLGDQFDYIGMFKAIKKLTHKYPRIRLHIVGTGPQHQFLLDQTKEMGISKHVQFHGQLSHDKAMELIASCQIGVALYNGNWSFNYYGDSMKCREFFYFSMPVLTTNTHSTVDEIVDYQAGIVCEAATQYSSAIDKLFTKYQRYSKAAGQLGKKYSDIHNQLLENLV